MVRNRSYGLLASIFLAGAILACNTGSIQPMAETAVADAATAIATAASGIANELGTAIATNIPSLPQNPVSNNSPTEARGNGCPMTIPYVEIPSTTSRLRLRSSPEIDDTNIKGIVTSGQCYNFVQKTDSWVQIDTSIGIGWVSGEYVRVYQSTLNANAGLSPQATGENCPLIGDYVEIPTNSVNIPLQLGAQSSGPILGYAIPGQCYKALTKDETGLWVQIEAIVEDEISRTRREGWLATSSILLHFQSQSASNQTSAEVSDWIIQTSNDLGLATQPLVTGNDVIDLGLPGGLSVIGGVAEIHQAFFSTGNQQEALRGVTDVGIGGGLLLLAGLATGIITLPASAPAGLIVGATAIGTTILTGIRALLLK